MNPCIAVIDNNTLSAIALQNILWEIFPEVEIVSFSSMEAFYTDCNRHFVHFFVCSDIFLKNVREFDMLKKETIITSLGGVPAFEQAGFKVIDVSLPEHQLVASILSLHSHGHASRGAAPEQDTQLSTREEEVLKLIAKGFINKEIADMLNISVPTVVYHRNNICSKLGTRSIGKLTIRAVLSGLVSVNEL